MKSLQDKYRSRGLRLIAVNAWDEPRDMLRGFKSQLDLPYTILVDGGAVFEKKYKGRSVPINYLLDSEGRITYVHLGWDNGDEEKLSRQIEDVLSKSGG